MDAVITGGIIPHPVIFFASLSLVLAESFNFVRAVARVSLSRRHAETANEQMEQSGRHEIRNEC